MSDFIRELEDELKQERLLGFFKAYGKFIAGVIVFVIVVASILTFKESSKIKAEIAASEEFRTNVELEASDANAASAIYEKISQDAPSGFAGLAVLKRAGMLANEGKIKEAVEVYDEFANSSKSEIAFREFARFIATYLMVENDLGEVEELNSRFDKLTKDNHPWRYSALELKAIYALKQGDKEQALEIFKNLSKNKLIPLDLRTRADKMVNIIG